MILSHHMLAGLTGVKMSKSDPDSAIFMEDTVKDVNRKVKKAWCPPGVVTETGADGAVKTNGCMPARLCSLAPPAATITNETTASQWS